MATLRQHASSKTNWVNAIWLAVIVMLGSWNLPFLDKWMTPEAVACGSLIINVIMRKIARIPLEDK